MSLESGKYIGGIGALLIVIGVAGVFGAYLGLLTLVGAILVLVAVHELADFYKEKGIFNNMLYSIILLIVGVVVCIAVMVFAAFSALAELGYDYSAGDWEAFGRMFAEGMPTMDFGALFAFIGAAIIALVVLFIFVVVAAFFLRKSLSAIASKTGVRMFATAGMLMLVGGVLTIVVVGFLLIWIAWILVAIAFFMIRT